jgi:predicted Fe-Mo cluster-binding NifX family protein
VKIAITLNRAGLNASISNRFGILPYLIILDTQTWNYEIIPNPGYFSHQGGGIGDKNLLFQGRSIGREALCVKTK